MYQYIMKLSWRRRIFVLCTFFLIIQGFYLLRLTSSTEERTVAFGNNDSESKHNNLPSLRSPLQMNKPNYLSICTVFKDEAEYIVEWIQFHKIVGVEKFYLYNHNSSDNVEAILLPFIKSGDVVLVPAVDGYDEKAKHRLTQTLSFEDCLLRFGNNTRWMAFMDVDEFLFPTQKKDLQQVLVDYEQYPGVVVRSLLFGSSGHVVRPTESPLVIENYIHRAHVEEPAWTKTEDDVKFHIKSIVDPTYARACRKGGSHYFCYEPNTTFAVNERKVLQNPPATKGSAFIDQIRYNHYKCKSYEDYFEKQMKGTVQGWDASKKFAKFGNKWPQVDKNEVTDTTIWRFLPQLKTAMGLPSYESIPHEKALPSTWLPDGLPSFSGQNNVGLIVLGMHHSGTSLISRMLIEMGVYAGEYKDLELLTGPDPDKFWERKDLCEANHDLIIDQTIRGPWYLGFGYDSSKLTGNQTAVFHDRANIIMRKIRHNNSTWFLKDPRMSITISQWRKHLPVNNTVCILPYRHPYLVSSGKAFASHLNVTDMLTTWEKYELAPLKGCTGYAKVTVDHGKLVSDPFMTLLKFHRDLTAIGIDGLKVIPKERVFYWFQDPSKTKFKEREITEDNLKILTSSQLALWKDFEDSSVLTKNYGDPDSPTVLPGEVLDQGAVLPYEGVTPPLYYDIRFYQYVKEAQKKYFSWGGGNEVIAFYANSYFVELARNAICNLQHLKITRFLVLALDDQLCEQIRDLRVTCWFDPYMDNIPGKADWNKNATSDYAKILYRKMYWVQQIISYEFNLLLFDTDVVFLRNPLEFLFKMKEVYAQNDLIIASDTRNEKKGSEDWVCAGMFYIKSNNRSREFMAQIMPFAKLGIPDQDLFQLVLTGHMQVINPDEYPQIGHNYKTAGEIGLKYHLLDANYFPNGGQYFEQREPQKSGVSPVALHSNQRHYAQKRQCLIEENAWHLNMTDANNVTSDRLQCLNYAPNYTMSFPKNTEKCLVKWDYQVFMFHHEVRIIPKFESLFSNMGWNHINDSADEISYIGSKGDNWKVPDPKKPIPRNAEISTFVKNHDQSRVWFLDASELSPVQMTYWWRVMDTPLCMIIYAHPVFSMEAEGIKIDSSEARQFYKDWEAYHYDIMQSCAEANAPIVPINLQHVGSDPKEGATHIFNTLKKAGARKFHQINGLKIFSAKEADQYKVRYSPNHPSLSFSQQMLVKEMGDVYAQQRVFNWTTFKAHKDILNSYISEDGFIDPKEKGNIVDIEEEIEEMEMEPKPKSNKQQAEQKEKVEEKDEKDKEETEAEIEESVPPPTTNKKQPSPNQNINNKPTNQKDQVKNKDNKKELEKKENKKNE